MTEPLESRLESPSLKEELMNQIKQYPHNLAQYAKGLALPMLVSLAGAYYGPELAHELGFNGEGSKIVGTYICGYAGGYGTTFTVEFLRNKNRYKSMFTKEFGKYVGTFLASDYISDPISFQPAFWLTKSFLENHANFSDGERFATSWLVAGICWIGTMAALHPLIRRANDYVSRSIKNIYHHFVTDKKTTQNFIDTH